MSGTVAEEKALANLTEATQPLVQCGFSPSMFTAQNIYDQFYFVHEFLKLIKQLSSIKDNRELVRTLALAVPTYWSAPDSATLRNLIDFSKWLKTDAGRAKLVALGTQMRLERRGGDYLSVTDVAAVNMANRQVSDYAVNKKKLRGEFDAKITKLRGRICLLEMRRGESETESEFESKITELKQRIPELEDEMKWELEGLRDRFSPMADYEPPTRSEFELAAYDLYMLDAQKRNLRYFDRGEEGYAIAVKNYGSIARDQHMLKWINEEDRDKVLLDYFKQKAIYLEGIGHRKQANKLRNLMVAAGGEEFLNAAVVYVFEFGLPESSRDILKRKATGAIETSSAAARPRTG